MTKHMNEFSENMRKVRLSKLVEDGPNKHGIKKVSKNIPPKEMDYDDFVKYYGDNPTVGAISMGDTVEIMTTYRSRNAPMTGTWIAEEIPPMTKEEFLKSMRGF